jgi:hypothetical protein
MCLECGFYKGRMVVDMVAKKKAREERLLVKQEAINSQQPEMVAPTEKETKEVSK